MGIRFKDYLSERRSASFEPTTEEKNEEDQSVEALAASIVAGDDAQLDAESNS